MLHCSVATESDSVIGPSQVKSGLSSPKTLGCHLPLRAKIVHRLIIVHGAFHNCVRFVSSLLDHQSMSGMFCE